MQQLTINLERSLVEQFPDWMDVVRASIYDCGRPFKNIAADLDMASSELSRRLAEKEAGSKDIPALMEMLPGILQATGDHRPVHWLIERFLESEEARKKRLLDSLNKMLPQLQGALNQLRNSGT